MHMRMIRRALIDFKRIAPASIGTLFVLLLMGMWVVVPNQSLAQNSNPENAGQQAAGQQSYDTIPIDSEYIVRDTRGLTSAERREAWEKSKRILNMASQVRAMLKSERGLDTTVFDSYFKNKYFAPMTQTGPEDTAAYGSLREDFFDQVMTTNGAVRNHLLDLAFNTMKPVVAGNFHPAAKINALLLIGKLDSRRGRRGIEVPQPYEPALDFLVSQITDAAVPQLQKIAAMVGIKRHLNLRPVGTANALPGDKVNALSTALVAMLNASATDDNSTTTDNKNQASEYWLRRQATQALGGLGFAGNGVADHLKKIKCRLMPTMAAIFCN